MTTPPEFQRPGASEGFSPSKNPEWLNKLCIMRPHYVEHIIFDPTQGPKEVVNAFVMFVDLQGPPDGRPVTINGAQIGGAGLVPQLKGKLGQLVLGRLVQGPQQGAKSGIYKLDPGYTDADAAMAGQAMQQWPLPPAPEAPPVAPAPQPVASPWAPQGQAPAAAPQAWGQPAPQGPPADVWAGTNAIPAGPPAGQWQDPNAQAQAPQAWQQQGQAPAPQPVAAPPAWQAQAPAAAPQAPAQQWGAAPAQPQFPAPATAQDPELVRQVQTLGVAIDPTWGNDVLQTIINSPRA